MKHIILQPNQEITVPKGSTAIPLVHSAEAYPGVCLISGQVAATYDEKLETVLIENLGIDPFEFSI